MPDEKKPGEYRNLTPQSVQAQRPTTKLEALTDRALLEDLARVGHETAKKVDTISDGVVDLNTRMDQMEERQDKFEQRLNTNSSIKGLPSKTDLELQASLAIEAASRVALEKKVDAIDKKQDEQTKLLVTNNNDTSSILRALGTEAKGFFERNPTLQKAFVAFLVAALIAGTVYFERLAR